MTNDGNKTIAFLSGKITGDDNYRQKFKRVQEALEEQGLTVLSPAVLPKIKWTSCMRITLAMLAEADVVVFLPDWRESAGARLEYYYSRLLNKPFIFLGNDTDE